MGLGGNLRRKDVIASGTARPYTIAVLDCGKTGGASLGSLAPKEENQRRLSLVRVPE
jgi:hypothetical protein